ncbi:hypothetical protein SCHIN_v1c10890 [Spiroplasma chinense]|uniref:Uncharacterized protein n=1 Tax=Spiroplasma chinense TaxID=216932 RepID=A0A5B9Y8D1_9MOLU|nr:hypothetical protein [Spiroplasma chinense]QEH62282.1 hypothetical protein SCHIN_v1c10890 [Spiroplasma chinense]
MKDKIKKNNNPTKTSKSIRVNNLNELLKIINAFKDTKDFTNVTEDEHVIDVAFNVGLKFNFKEKTITPIIKETVPPDSPEYETNRDKIKEAVFEDENTTKVIRKINRGMNVTVAREIERYNLKDVNKDCEKAIKDFEIKKDFAFMRLKQEFLEKIEAQERKIIEQDRKQAEQDRKQAEQDRKQAEQEAKLKDQEQKSIEQEKFYKLEIEELNKKIESIKKQK